MALPRLLLVVLGSCLLASLPGRAVAQERPSSDTARLAAHHTVAILPFEATVQVMQMRNLVYPSSTADAIMGQQPVAPDSAQQRQQREVAYQMQALTMQELQDQRPRHGYRVQWQPVAETNRRLLAAGISYAELARQPLGRLQQVLGVDALLTGQVLLYQPIPKTMALALRVLTHEPLLYGPSAVPPSQTEASLAIYDCATTRLVWQFDFGRTGANALPPVRLASRLVRAALPTLPYAITTKTPSASP